MSNLTWRAICFLTQRSPGRDKPQDQLYHAQSVLLLAILVCLPSRPPGTIFTNQVLLLLCFTALSSVKRRLTHSHAFVESPMDFFSGTQVLASLALLIVCAAPKRKKVNTTGQLEIQQKLQPLQFKCVKCVYTTCYQRLTAEVCVAVIIVVEFTICCVNLLCLLYG